MGTPPDWISASIAVVAFVLSIVNFIGASRLERQQYALGFSRDVIKWANKVLDETGKLREWFTAFEGNERPEFIDVRRYVDRLGVLQAKGRLFISVRKQLKTQDEVDEHQIIDLVNDLRNVGADLADYPDEKAVFDQSKELTRLEGIFTAKMQRLVRAPKRFEKAMEYLNADADALATEGMTRQSATAQSQKVAI